MSPRGAASAAQPKPPACARACGVGARRGLCTGGAPATPDPAASPSSAGALHAAHSVGACPFARLLRPAVSPVHYAGPDLEISGSRPSIGKYTEIVYLAQFFGLDPFLASVTRTNNFDTPKRCRQATDPPTNPNTKIPVFTLYHPGKANVVADALSHKSVENLAMMITSQQPVLQDMRRLELEVVAPETPMRLMALVLQPNRIGVATEPYGKDQD